MLSWSTTNLNLQQRFAIVTTSLPITLLIDIYLLFFSPTSLTTDFLQPLYITLYLWLSLVLALLGLSRLVWVYLKSRDTVDLAVLILSVFSGAFLWTVVFLVLFLYVLPSVFWYGGFWGYYVVRSVRAYRRWRWRGGEDLEGQLEIELGKAESQPEPESSEQNENRKENTHLEQRIDRESSLGYYVSALLIWSNMILSSSLRFPSPQPPSTPETTPAPGWHLEPPFNTRIPIPVSIDPIVRLLVRYTFVFGFLGICCAFVLWWFEYRVKARGTVKDEDKTRIDRWILVTRVCQACSGVLFVAGVGVVVGGVYLGSR